MNMYHQPRTHQPPTMTNTGGTKRRSNSSEDGKPPSKRPMISASGPEWPDLRPELIGHIARFLPMGTPDMMRLLSCVGPRVAAVVRKMYLADNEYYLECYQEAEVFNGVEKDRVRECIGYWMDHNEKAWKKRCLGKKHKGNVHTVMLTPEDFRSFDLEHVIGLLSISYDISDSFYKSAHDKASLDVLEKLFKRSPHLFLVSIAEKNVDDGLVTVEECRSVIDSLPINSDGKISVGLMSGNDALFAYPQLLFEYDLISVLKYMIEKKIIEPSTAIASLDEDGDRSESLLLHVCLAAMNESADCFRYLLSLPGTDINAISSSFETEDIRGYENIIHSCLEAQPTYLKSVIAHSKIDLNSKNSNGETALCKGSRLSDLGDDTIAKLRLLLKAGADPRIADDDGESALSNILTQITDAEEDENSELKDKLFMLLQDCRNTVEELDDKERQNS